VEVRVLSTPLTRSHMIQKSSKSVCQFLGSAMVCKCSTKNSAELFTERTLEKTDSSISILIPILHCFGSFRNSSDSRMRGFHCFLLMSRTLDSNQEVLLTHGDSINQVADSFKTVGTSGNFIVGKFFSKVSKFRIKSVYDYLVFSIKSIRD